jgi:D-xylose transport system substrate-binding protein
MWRPAFRPLWPAILGLLFLSAAHCPPAAAQSAAPSTLKIGFLMDSLKIERWQTDLDLFQKRAKELGAEVLMETAEGDDNLQFQQAQKLLAAGIRALVIVPHNTDEAVRIVTAAKAKYVPVVDYERLIRNCDIDFFVGVDAEAIGEIQARTLTNLAPKGNYVLIAGSPSDINAKIIHDGQLKVLKPYVDRGDIKIVGDFWATDWKPMEAYSGMIQAIDSVHGDITAVVASNDGTAGGAIQALDDHKLAGKVFVSGQDADLAAIIHILDGTQTMTIYKPLGEEAKRAAEVAVSLAKGEPLKAGPSISNGYKNVPALFVTPVVVIKSNVMDTVIKDGFQNLDTIKKSLPKDKWPQ